jgi:mono/diheme cytochrome c family protein
MFVDVTAQIHNVTHASRQHLVEGLVVCRRSGLLLALLVLLSSSLMGMKLSNTDSAYVRQVLRRSGDPAQGQAIFEMNCAVCHGVQGSGNVGPSLKAVGNRKSRSSLITQVISGQTPPMPQFQPSEQTMADLLSYLEVL